MRMTKERKYLLGIGGLLVLIGLAYNLYPTLRQLRPDDDQVLLKQQKIAKYERLLQRRDSLEKRLTASETALSSAQQQLLTGKTAALAGADIQNIIGEISTANGVEIKTLRLLKADGKVHSDYVAIPVEFTVRSSVRQLKDVLYGIETAGKRLTIKEINVRPVRSRNSEDVQATITVAGYMKKDAAS